MSSTLLVVLIVVLWLAVLAPLLLRNQKQVRKTTQALQETRVLFKGGSGQIKTRFPRPVRTTVSATRTSDDQVADNQVEDDEYFLLDEDEVVAEPVIADEQQVVTTPVELDSELVDEGELVEDVTVEPEDESVASEVVFEYAEDELIDVDEVTDDETEVDVEAEAEVEIEDEIEEDDAVVMERVQRPEAYIRPADLEGFEDSDPAFAVSDHEDTEAEPKEAAVLFDDGFDALTDEQVEQLAEEETEVGEQLTADDEAYVSSRRGRGIYDPEVARRNAQRRLQRRQRTLLVLGAVWALLAILAVTAGSGWWWGVGLSTVVIAAYLYNLRKQALEDQRMAARRLARMRRARMGVRNVADEELGVPQRLRRPSGVVVETVDGDPDLVELEYADASDYFTIGEPEFHRGPQRTADEDLLQHSKGA